ncbi:MAG: PEGA domain-containing protein [Candidatus Saccharicenans sp.]|nr:PEGA domain-containing protein [Candidatus Saccharicenans sp.]
MVSFLRMGNLLRLFSYLLIITLIFQRGYATQATRLQKIPVTNNPVQSRILVDGQEIGYTPLTLSLPRDRNHTIKIEKEGYEPALIQVQPGTPAGSSTAGRFIAGLPITIAGMFVGLVVGYLVSPTQPNSDHKYASFVIGGALLGAVPGVIIMARKTDPILEPGAINIILKRAPEGETGAGSVQTIRLTFEQLSSLRRIRISCADN